MGHPLAQNGAALAPFRANGAHPSNYICPYIPPGPVTCMISRKNVCSGKSTRVNSLATPIFMMYRVCGSKLSKVKHVLLVN